MGKRRVNLPVPAPVVASVPAPVVVRVILPCSYAAARGAVVREQGFAIQRARLSQLHYGRFIPRRVTDAIISWRKSARGCCHKLRVYLL
jgi:hypothetical protein